MYSKALLNEVPVHNRGELHNGHFDKHSPLLKLECFRIFQYAQKCCGTAEGTGQQDAQEQERADLGTPCVKSLPSDFSLLETFVGATQGGDSAHFR